MADRYLLESGAPDGYQLEDASGVLLLDAPIDVALSGQEVATSAGTLTPGTTYSAALAGQSVATGTGTLGVTSSVALSGQAVTATAGTLTSLATYTAALSGQAVTPSAGTLGVTHNNALAGQAVTLSAGTLGPAASLALAGQSVATAGGTLVPSVSVTVALSGASVASNAGTLGVTADIGLTGQAVTVSAGTWSAAVETVIALTGQEITVFDGTLMADHPPSVSVESPTAHAAMPWFPRGSKKKDKRWSIITEYGLQDAETYLQKSRLAAAVQAEDSIQNELDANIARLLHVQEAKDLERADLERLQRLADRYQGMQVVESERVQKALLKAQEARTRGALEALRREIGRVMDEEDMAVLMLLLNQ